MFMGRLIDKSRVPPLLWQGAREAVRLCRFLTAPVRVMPDFIIIGAQRAGTTSLFHYARQHPCIGRSFGKELHFFDNLDGSYHKGIMWYRAHFPSYLHKYYARKVRGLDMITGEASPYYLFHPLVARRISRVLPTVKLIAMLRNPVDRAYSHYHHNVKYGLETLSFEAALDKEPERLDGELEKILHDGRYRGHNHQHYSYLARGVYVNQLKNWFSVFAREQMLIIKSEDFYADRLGVMRTFLEFIGAPAWEPTGYKQYNLGGYSKLDPAMRARLVEYFRPHNQRLYEYLGRDFGWDE